MIYFKLSGISLDAEGINDQASEFISAVRQSGHVEENHRRASLLMEFGKYSLFVWDWVFATADSELQNILLCFYIVCFIRYPV